MSYFSRRLKENSLKNQQISLSKFTATRNQELEKHYKIVNRINTIPRHVVDKNAMTIEEIDNQVSDSFANPTFRSKIVLQRLAKF